MVKEFVNENGRHVVETGVSFYCPCPSNKGLPLKPEFEYMDVIVGEQWVKMQGLPKFYNEYESTHQ